MTTQYILRYRDFVKGSDVTYIIDPESPEFVSSYGEIIAPTTKQKPNGYAGKKISGWHVRLVCTITMSYAPHLMTNGKKLPNHLPKNMAFPYLTNTAA